MKARLLVLLLAVLCASPVQATVNEVFSRNDYVGNASTTSFPYTFRIINQADVLVLLNGVLQTLNTQYTVIGMDNPGGGAVIFATAPPLGNKVALLRAQRFQQLSIYTPNEAFPAKRIESDFDKNTMEDQRHVEEIGRALKFDPHSLFRNVFVDDPTPGKCLAWNAATTRVVSADCSGGAGGVGTGNVIGDGAAGQVTFWTGLNTVAGDSKFLWDNSTKALTVGTTPLGPLKPGNAFMGLQGPSDATGMQNLMLQTVQGDPSLIGLVTLGDDRVGISSWNFRGTGATNPIYGANFGVVFNTNGVANGLEIDVQNDSATNFQGQALWLNGSTRAVGASGTVGHRANAILIDTQDGSKWERGILFKQGFIGGGATGSISSMGIHFEQSQDADFIVIQPRIGAGANVAVKVTNPSFTQNRFELLNSGTLRVSNSMTGPAFPSYSFIEGAGPSAGMYLEAVGTAPSTGAVLGWSVNSLRRLTLGDALNVWNSGVGASQGGTINFFDPTAVHSVGLMSPDFVGNSFRIKLPNVPGVSGQCMITDGGFPISTWSYAACGTGGPGGSGTVTNTGVLTLNALILGDGGVAVKALGSLGTATTVLHGNVSGAPTFGPVVVADIGATGTPNSTTFLRGDGTWSTPAGSGTVTGTGALNQLAFWTGASAVAGSNELQFDNATKQFTLNTLGSLTDPSSWAVARMRLGSDLTTPTNQFGLAIQVSTPVTGSVISYEKAGLLIQTLSHDPSTGLIQRDIVGIDTRGVVSSTNPAGRAWGLFTQGVIQSGGDGLALAAEFSIHNSGTNQPIVGTVTSKYNLGLTATGSATAGIYFNATGIPTWNKGIFATPADFFTGPTNTFIELFNTFTVTPGGILSIGALPSMTASPTAILRVGAALGGTVPIAVLESTTLGTSVVRPALALKRSTTGQMADGFGVRQEFTLRDADAADNIVAQFIVDRHTTDNTGIFRLQTAVAGATQDRFVINQNGQFFFNPTPTVGTFALSANGTRRMELQFQTNNGTNAVALIAPASATGNHVWTLPTTLGIAGDVLTSAGGGVLLWSPGSGGPGPSFSAMGCNAKDFGAVSNGTTNDNAAINSALAACNTVFLPKNTKWIPSIAVPSNKVITGEDVNSVIIDARSSSGGSGFFSIGQNVVVQFATVLDNNTAPSFGKMFWQGRVGATTTDVFSPVGQDGAFTFNKAGPLNSVVTFGMAVNHDGLGSGDNFYAQATPNATGYADALFRGDMYASNCGASIGHPELGCGTIFAGYMFSTASPNSTILSMADARTATGTNASAIFHQTTTRTTGPMVTFRQGTSTFSGNVLALDMAFGSGNFTGNYALFTHNGIERFKAAANGDLTIAGNFTAANAGVFGSYYINSIPGFGSGATMVKVMGACTVTIIGGLITNVTGC